MFKAMIFSEGLRWTDSAITPSPFGESGYVAQNISESSSLNHQKMLKKICPSRSGKMQRQIPRHLWPHVCTRSACFRPVHSIVITPYALGIYENRVQVSLPSVFFSFFRISYYYKLSNLSFQEDDIRNIWTSLFALFLDIQDVIKADWINKLLIRWEHPKG